MVLFVEPVAGLSGILIRGTNGLRCASRVGRCENAGDGITLQPLQSCRVAAASTISSTSLAKAPSLWRHPRDSWELVWGSEVELSVSRRPDCRPQFSLYAWAISVFQFKYRAFHTGWSLKGVEVLRLKVSAC